MFASQVKCHRLQIGFRIANEAAIAMMGVQQAQIGFLHHILSILVGAATDKETAKCVFMLLEYGNKVTDALLGHQRCSVLNGLITHQYQSHICRKTYCVQVYVIAIYLEVRRCIRHPAR